MVVAVGFSQWIEPPLSPHGWEALAPGHSSNHAGQLRSEMHPDWAVIKFLIEEIQRYGQSRRTAVFGASCLEPTCPLSRSPQLCPRASSLWISARRGKQSSTPQCREKVTRKQEGPLLLRACCKCGLSTQGGCSLILEAGGRLTQTDLFSWQIWTRGSGLFLSPSFIQTAYKCSAGKGD